MNRICIDKSHENVEFTKKWERKQNEYVLLLFYNLINQNKI